MIYWLLVIFSGFTAWLTCRALIYFSRSKKFQSKLCEHSGEKLAALLIDYLTEREDVSEEIIAHLAQPSMLAKLHPHIDRQVDQFLGDKFEHTFPLIAKFIGTKTKSQFKKAFMEEIEITFPVLLLEFGKELRNDPATKEFIKKRLMAEDWPALLTKIYRSQNLKTWKLELYCFLLGSFTGSLQALLIYLFYRF